MIGPTMFLSFRTFHCSYHTPEQRGRKLADYTRVRWFSYLDPLTQPEYACDIDCTGVTVASVPGMCSGFYVLILIS